VDKELKRILEESERMYSIEHGAKHVKIRVEGRLVLILPRTALHRDANRNRATMNARAQLKRELRRA
jgi:hypothetical protein